jgi:putative Holliday junction resolvase
MQFIDHLREKLDIPVKHWDERLTSVRAEAELRLLGGKKGRKRKVDEMSAAFILQSFLLGGDEQDKS